MTCSRTIWVMCIWGTRRKSAQRLWRTRVSRQGGGYFAGARPQHACRQRCASCCETGTKALRQLMFAVAKFRSRKATDRVVVSATAIMRLHDKDWVFRKEGEKNFRRVVVQADGLAPDGMQEIRDGVKVGDEVVANALEFSTEVAAGEKENRDDFSRHDRYRAAQPPDGSGRGSWCCSSGESFRSTISPSKLTPTLPTPMRRSSRSGRDTRPRKWSSRLRCRSKFN